ncbi:hypothetical protein ABTM97_19450, partial [Acinetobacter baumannii]
SQTYQAALPIPSTWPLDGMTPGGRAALRSPVPQGQQPADATFRVSLPWPIVEVLPDGMTPATRTALPRRLPGEFATRLNPIFEDMGVIT